VTALNSSGCWSRFPYLASASDGPAPGPTTSWQTRPTRPAETAATCDDGNPAHHPRTPRPAKAPAQPRLPRRPPHRLRQRALQETQHGRTRHQPPQGLPSRRHPLRKTRLHLPRHRHPRSPHHLAPNMIRETVSSAGALPSQAGTHATSTCPKRAQRKTLHTSRTATPRKRPYCAD
jgi:hypothetical protein